MNTNNNDYVIVNGRKYFADGGKNNSNTEGITDYPDSWNEGDILSYKNGIPSSPAQDPSHTFGHHYFAHLDDNLDTQNGSRKQMFLEGRKKVSDFLRTYDKDVLKKYGIDDKVIQNWDDDTIKYGNNNPEGYDINSYKSGEFKGFDNDNSRRVYYFLADIGNSKNFKKNSKGKEYFTKDENGKVTKYQGIPMGENVTKGISTFNYGNNFNYLSDDERQLISNLADSDLKGAVNKDEKGNIWFSNDDYTTWRDNDGNKHVTIGVGHKQYEPGKVKRGGTYSFVISSDGKSLLPIKANEDNSDYDFDYDNPNANKVIRDIRRKNSNNNLTSLVGRKGNIFRIYSDDKNKLFNNWHPKYESYGGPTTRLYAVGGTSGEQIPIGEQPEDYNMVANGGSHEQNPMGGVPYGMNQDGSQNMVEQGEVSVGNNVFSDRTAISPELCQQLGLPEGTSPAQAMQQIQQLYEQGQIGDQEFQEIQQIIFDDQEAQKQNVGGSYQQGQVGGEGITPDMMQGQNMPPQAMPQQGAPEGIAPEMVQGGAYAFGGRRRC